MRRDLLSHELVQPGVEVSPHVAVEMDPPNTGRMSRSLDPVQPGEVGGHPVHHHVLQVEELAHGVAHPTQGPQWQLGDDLRLRWRERELVVRGLTD